MDFYSYTCVLPDALSFIAASFPKGLLNTSHPGLCHFRLRSLKLALGESFLVLTVEQILFNITIESFLPCCWLPLTPSPPAPPHIVAGIPVVHVFPSTMRSDGYRLHRDKGSET